jgi:hypothetical protein
MNAVSLPKEIEFVRHHPENFILVENEAGGTVLVRAARNNYSDRQKRAFIRELAAEGFIPDHLERISDPDFGGSPCGVHWVIDHSWMQIHSAVQRKATRAVVTMLLIGVLLWGLLMFLAFLRAH